jgi:hypothetical protein
MMHCTPYMLQILEPSFYFKIEEQLHLNTPSPEVLQWSMSAVSRSSSQAAISNLLVSAFPL